MDPNVQHCKACGQSVLFVVAKKSGKINILDAEAHPNGNVAIIGGLAVFDSKLDPLPDDAIRYVSHFSSCPFGSRIREQLKQLNEDRAKQAKFSWE